MAVREIKFRDHCGDLVGRQNGMMFIIRTEPGVIAGTPAHWVAVVLGDGAPNFSTMGHQYFHLDEAKEFCRQIAAGEIDLAVLRAQYEAEDKAKNKAKILDIRQNLSTRVVLFRACLKAKGLTCSDLLELESMLDALGERGRDILLELEREEKCPGGVEAPTGRASREAYHENTNIVPQESAVCKGVFE